MLEPGETVLWIGKPDSGSTLQTQSVLWWIGVPWTVGVLALLFFDLLPRGWEWPLALPGIAFLAAPILLGLYAGGTRYAITDRRALIGHNALGKREAVSIPFDDMDEKLEVLPTRPGYGHLYFASGKPTKLSDVDYTGKLAFREIAGPDDVARILERARTEWRAHR